MIKKHKIECIMHFAGAKSVAESDVFSQPQLR
ncbi:TPA: hypothetical protein ACG5ZV_003344 [Escherichia coli]